MYDTSVKVSIPSVMSCANASRFISRHSLSIAERHTTWCTLCLSSRVFNEPLVCSDTIIAWQFEPPKPKELTQAILLPALSVFQSLKSTAISKLCSRNLIFWLTLDLSFLT